MESEGEGRRLLGRWRTVGETDPHADRHLLVERVVEYRVRLSGTYQTRTPEEQVYSTAAAAFEEAARIRAGFDGRGKLQRWQAIDRSGRPITEPAPPKPPGATRSGERLRKLRPDA